MPAKKKHPSTRNRRNKTAGAATLTRRLAVVPDKDPYAGMTVARLRAEIDARNEDRADGRHIPKRGNKAALIDLLAMDDIAPDRSVPALPDIRVDGWHELTQKWWTDVWTSPLPDQWDTATDFWNVLMVADLLNDWLQADTAKSRREAMSEIRLQRGDLGLSPRARLSLEWIFETTDEAKAKGQERRQRKQSDGGQRTVKGKKPVDPRAAFSVVN